MSQPANPSHGIHFRQLPAPPRDPASDPCPNWTATWTLPYIQSLMAAETDASGTKTRAARSAAEATAVASEAWRTAHAVIIQEWDRWLALKTEAERLDQADENRLAAEEALRQEEMAERDAQATVARQHQEEEEALQSARQSMLKKRADQQATLFEIPRGVAPSAVETLIPSQYAIDLLKQHKSAPFKLFHPNYIRNENKARASLGYDNSDVSVGQIRNGQFEFVSAGAPKNIPANTALSWAEVTAAISVMSQAMKRCGAYTASACTSVASLVVELNHDARFRGDEQEKTNVIYTSHILEKFFQALRFHIPGDVSTPKLFDCSEIDMDIWMEYRAELRDAAQSAATCVPFPFLFYIHTLTFSLTRCLYTRTRSCTHHTVSRTCHSFPEPLAPVSCFSHLRCSFLFFTKSRST
jgi:hypothetical protein